MTGRSNRRRMGEYTVAVLLVDTFTGTGDQKQMGECKRLALSHLDINIQLLTAF